ncbi:MAG TPA: hypothetical protein VF818_11405 [Ktedonobacterales bacterium]
MRWYPFVPRPGFDAPWWGLAHLLGGVLGMLFWLALAGLIVWAIVRLARRQPPQATPTTTSAAEVLRQRYARGEIDGATFSEMMERLSASEAAHWERTGSARSEGVGPTDYVEGPPAYGADQV